MPRKPNRPSGKPAPGVPQRQFQLRLPETLYDLLDEASRNQSSSMNGEIVRRLTESFGGEADRANDPRQLLDMANRLIARAMSLIEDRE